MRSSPKSNAGRSLTGRRTQPIVIMLSRLAVIVLAGAALQFEAAYAEKAVPTLAVPDVLAVPGKAIRLEARLREATLLTPRGLGGEQLDFTVDLFRRVSQTIRIC